jgi:uncharacterized membrane protein
VTEDDDQSGRGGRPADNSLGRLLTLSDGVFAIAMTLLALDLKVPDVGSSPSDHALRHALAHNADNYWSFLITFYVVAVYWVRHRKLMRSVVAGHDVLVRDTLCLLLVVAAMPFPASMLGRYGGVPITIAVYGAVNALATVAILLLRHDIRRLALADPDADLAEERAVAWQMRLNLVVFLLCIPAGYVLGHQGPLVLLLLLVPERVDLARRLIRRARERRAAADAAG